MNNKIGIHRYVFTESFAFEIPEGKSVSYVFTEIFKHVPLFSIPFEAKNLHETLNKRKAYYSRDHHSRIYDVRFSSLVVIKQTVNLIGLGILILPIRITATYMKREDKINFRTCENPHMLDFFKQLSCTSMNAHTVEHYQALLRMFPGEEDYCRRMAIRDHVKFPEYLMGTYCVYDDPFGKATDLPFKVRAKQISDANALKAIKAIRESRRNHVYN